MLAMNERLEELRLELDKKTTEIESMVAAERGMGSIENMDSSEYERLQHDVEGIVGAVGRRGSRGAGGNLRYTTKQTDCGTV
jgi:hypothetical protein